MDSEERSSGFDPPREVEAAVPRRRCSRGAAASLGATAAPDDDANETSSLPLALILPPGASRTRRGHKASPREIFFAPVPPPLDDETSMTAFLIVSEQFGPTKMTGTSSPPPPGFEPPTSPLQPASPSASIAMA